MSAPYLPHDQYGGGLSLLVALGIGFAFGFFLERGGLGNARKLAGQFYLRDLTVFKVMFTAIITALLGLFWLARLGILDLESIRLTPTYLWPQLAGGLIFGLGFVLAGLCPGTACVALATGKIDGFVVLLGIMSGIFVFAESLELYRGFFYSSALGSVTLPGLSGLPHGLVVLAVVLLALAGFAGASALERRHGDEGRSP